MGRMIPRVLTLFDEVRSIFLIGPTTAEPEDDELPVAEQYVL